MSNFNKNEFLYADEEPLLPNETNEANERSSVKSNRSNKSQRESNNANERSSVKSNRSNQSNRESNKGSQRESQKKDVDEGLGSQGPKADPKSGERRGSTLLERLSRTFDEAPEEGEIKKKKEKKEGNKDGEGEDGDEEEKDKKEPVERGGGAGPMPTVIAIVKNVVGAGLLPLPQTWYNGTPTWAVVVTLGMAVSLVMVWSVVVTSDRKLLLEDFVGSLACEIHVTDS